jgi:hypothetical protein
LFDLVVEVAAGGGAGDAEAGVAGEEAGGAVDELADDVGVAGVALGLGRDVDEDVVEGDGAVAPPGHPPEGIQGSSAIVASARSQVLR